MLTLRPANLRDRRHRVSAFQSYGIDPGPLLAAVAPVSKQYILSIGNVMLLVLNDAAL